MLERKTKASVPEEVQLDAEEESHTTDEAERDPVIRMDAYRRPGARESADPPDGVEKQAKKPKKVQRSRNIRFNLTIPEPLYRELEELAVENHTSELELMRTALRLAILGLKAQRVPGEGLVLCTGGTERLLLLP